MRCCRSGVGSGFGDAQSDGKLAFKVVDGFGGGIRGGEEIERSMKEVVKVADRGIRFCGLRETITKIPGGESLDVAAPDAESRVDEMCVAENVKVGFARGDPDDFGAEEQIEPAGEWAFWSQRAFGNRPDDAVGFRAPGDDETGVGEFGTAKQDGGGFFHGRKRRGW